MSDDWQFAPDPDWDHQELGIDMQEDEEADLWLIRDDPIMGISHCLCLVGTLEDNVTA